jgi:hypothetical protein
MKQAYYGASFQYVRRWSLSLTRLGHSPAIERSNPATPLRSPHLLEDNTLDGFTQKCVNPYHLHSLSDTADRAREQHKRRLPRVAETLLLYSYHMYILDWPQELEALAEE